MSISEMSIKTSSNNWIRFEIKLSSKLHVLLSKVIGYVTWESFIQSYIISRSFFRWRKWMGKEIPMVKRFDRWKSKISTRKKLEKTSRYIWAWTNKKTLWNNWKIQRQGHWKTGFGHWLGKSMDWSNPISHWCQTYYYFGIQ